MQSNPADNETKLLETQPKDQSDTKAEESYPEDTPAMAEFRSRVLSKKACVTLADERKILGEIICIDQYKNIVIVHAVEEIPAQYVSSINEKLPGIAKSLMKIQNYANISPELEADPEKLKNLEEEFFKNKFYLGQAIIPGHCITKLEIVKAS